MSGADVASSNYAVVIRTDFSDQAAWERVRRVISTPDDIFEANVQFVDDPAFDGFEGARLIEVLTRRSPHGFAMVADRVTMTHAEHPVLVIDIAIADGRAFRAIPSQLASIENNLSIANMDYHEFADSVDDDGIFRDFPA